MPKQIKLRRGTTAQHAVFTGAEGEVTMDTSKKTLVVHDGITPGGSPLALPTSFVVNCGNVVMVDAVNGNDTTATRGKMQSPFLTLTVAKTAAVAGDTVLVLPGNYSGNNLAKNGVNWHFMPGAIVDFLDPTFDIEVGIFDTGPTGAGAPCTFKVTGNGVFYLRNSVVPFLNSYYTDDNISIACDSIETSYAAITSRGALRLECLYIRIEDGSGIISNGTGVKTLILGTLIANGGYGLSHSAGVTTAIADLITGMGGVEYTGGTLAVTAREISGTSSSAVSFSDTVTPHSVCLIRGSRLINNHTISPAVFLDGAGGGILRLSACHLVSLGTVLTSIEAIGAATVLLYGESTANKAKHANVTLVGSALTVDAALV